MVEIRTYLVPKIRELTFLDAKLVTFNKHHRKAMGQYLVLCSKKRCYVMYRPVSLFNQKLPCSI
jgi:hypothetical protein